MTPPFSTRVVIEELKPGFWRAGVPGRSTPLFLFGAFFCLCWLAGWAIGEVFALRTWFSSDDEKAGEWLILFWIFAWTLGGVFGVWLLHFLLGVSFGSETLILTERRIKFVRTLWGRSVPLEFPLPSVTGFDRNGRFGVHFRFRNQKISFGHSLQEEEVNWVVGELQTVLKSLKENPPADAEEDAGNRKSGL